MYTEQDILQQEAEAILHRFTNKDAWRLGNLVREFAGEKAEKICIDVSRGSQKLFYFAGEDTIPDNADWIRWKRNTVERFHHASYCMKMQFGGDFDYFYKNRNLSPEEYTIYGGGFPILVENAGMIGTVTVSGLDDIEDHMLCYRALCALRAEQEN